MNEIICPHCKKAFEVDEPFKADRYLKNYYQKKDLSGFGEVPVIKYMKLISEK